MQEPATAPWGLSISSTDLDKLTAGFEPQDSDDKWRITVMDQSQKGLSSVHLARSGTGIELYALFVQPNAGGNRSSGSGGKVEAISWEQNKGGIRISEDLAKKEVGCILRSLLECGFEALPEYDSVDVFDHPGAQLVPNEPKPFFLA